MQLNVELGSIHYPIYIKSGILSDLTILRPHIKGTQILLVSNETVAPLYSDKVLAGLSDFYLDTIILPDGEQYKNAASLARIYDKLMAGNFHRDATLIALGGGVIGDLCGFAAATYQRGIPFIQIPTTLLAQVDASVGGKTAINHPAGKNMIGCFYQPQAVVIDPHTLISLKEREYNAGMAEVIKYAFIYEPCMYEYIGDFIKKYKPENRMHVEELIYHCCRIKADFVMRDEKEQGCRALLNFGHTFAHALESVTHYQRWLHGEAVAIGMMCAVRLSIQLNFCDSEYLTRLESWLQHFSLPTAIPNGMDNEAILEAMQKDKKFMENTMRMILFRKPGDCFISNEVSLADIKKILEESSEG